MTASAKPGERILNALLERLYLQLARGPAINCHPGRSRQRLDLTEMERLGEGSAQSILAALLGEAREIRLRPTLEALPPLPKDKTIEEPPELRARRKAHAEKVRVLQKLALLAQDTKTFEADTGAYSLFIGYPVLSLPPTAEAGRGPTRVLAPLAFLPVELSVSHMPTPSVKLACSAEGAERVAPNVALKTWIERRLKITYPEMFEDEEGDDPAREFRELMQHVAAAMDVKDVPSLEGWPLQKIPDLKSLPDKPAILPYAMLGLYRLENQNCIMDMEELRKVESFPATVAPFLTLSESLVTDEDALERASTPDETDIQNASEAAIPASSEFLAAPADPCQRRAVMRSRSTKGLVIHGPPGTGKSQTITNIIADCLAREKRVLLVCEKRTALDVVKYRLDACGLGELCAVVHDAMRDRQALYMGVREALEGLADAPRIEDPQRELDRANAEIDRLNGELREYFDGLQATDAATGMTFHEMAGRWLENVAHERFETEGDWRTPADYEGAQEVEPSFVLARESEIVDAFARAQQADYANNAWKGQCGVTLDAFLARSMTDLRKLMQACVERAKERDGRIVAELPPYVEGVDVVEQGKRRAAIGERLKTLADGTDGALRAALVKRTAEAPGAWAAEFAAMAADRERVAQMAAQPELRMAFDADPWAMPRIQSAIGSLEYYISNCQGFMGFFQFGAKKLAREAIGPLGLMLSPENAVKAVAFLKAARARLVLRAFLEQKLAADGIAPKADEAGFMAQYDHAQAVLAFAGELEKDAAAAPIRAAVLKALPDASAARALAGLLARSVEEATAMRACADALGACGLFHEKALKKFTGDVLQKQPFENTARKFADDLDRFEPLLRFEEEILDWPGGLSETVRRMTRAGVDAPEGLRAIHAAVFLGALQRRMKANPVLQRMDAAKLDNAFRRLRQLSDQKRQTVSKRIAHIWQERQRRRLLAATGGRLNKDAGDLRRRLMLRGRNASRVRQVVHQGLGIEGGDPLFDMRPVWMASPETVSQIFPLAPLFDVVVFDEASQCRLEEGLPVLARGASVIIAGDVKQLPPSHFFEIATADSGADVEEDEDGPDAYFIGQQTEVEDLLSAALGIQIDQTYLDVHYRSRNEDLIQFSNESFYGSRLQAIPARPDRIATEPAIQLHAVNGTNVERQNEAEAKYVVDLLRKYLARKEPPSLGVVTFNRKQMELISDLLEEAALTDREFAARLETARNRWSDKSFEGLFVKNLENVQGDERDVMILSTTYGPSPTGKFFRRFGPLAIAGGERRLNVIVTRAREKVELVTSIPQSVYREDMAIPEGKRPTGSWFLMRYLRYAESLRDHYQETDRKNLATSIASAVSNAADPDAVDSDAADSDAGYSAGHEARPAPIEPEPIEVLGAGAPSRFARALANVLRERNGLSSMLYYGNEGFCVDVVPFQLEVKDNNGEFTPGSIPKIAKGTLTIGMLCDAPRYRRAADPVEWDNFQTSILEGQDWTLHRIWTPQFLRDPEGALKEIGKKL